MGVMMGAPSWTAHVNSMARSIASHTPPAKTGIIQYDIPNSLVVFSNEEWNWLLLQAQVVVISMRCSVCFLFALASFPTEFEGRRQRLWEGTKEEDEEGERGMGDGEISGWFEQLKSKEVLKSRKGAPSYRLYLHQTTNYILFLVHISRYQRNLKFRHTLDVIISHPRRSRSTRTQ